MPPGERTILSELENWLEDYAPHDLLVKTAKAIENVLKEQQTTNDTSKET